MRHDLAVIASIVLLATSCGGSTDYVDRPVVQCTSSDSSNTTTTTCTGGGITAGTPSGTERIISKLP